ncbi:MAG: deoxynucleoside kinase, partial [Saprospiraceae bacterium]|nr:deoxynucleoside kinase [Saprospiraceae bacterium]
MNPFFPYNFIAIEGNIGAGKSTLSKMIAKDFGGRLVLERFDD